MYCVYLLQSKTNPTKTYIGFTGRKMKDRLGDHNYGKVRATKQYLPWKLIYCEVYLSEKDARMRERKLKQYGGAWRNLKKRLEDTLR